MAAEYIDDTLNGSGQFPTKIPGYEDAADIQEALRLYHYGTSIIPATALEINAKSIAGYLKQLQTNIDNSAVDQSELAGLGIDWNSVSEQFDIDSTVATKSYVGHSTSTITKVSGFTLELADASKTILLNASSPMTLVIPSNVSVAIPVGYQYNFIEIGSARTTFSPASGVTVGSKNSQLFLDGTYSKGTLVKIATDTWILYGDVYEGVAVVTTTTAAPPFFPYFAPATTTAAPTTTTGAPPSFPFFPYFVPGTTGATGSTYTTTTTTTTTGATPAPTTTTTTVAPTPSFTTLPYSTNVTHNSFTINWVAANTGSWQVWSAGQSLIYGSGNGAGGSFTRSGLPPQTTQTQSVKIWSGPNQTGSSTSDAITVSTNMDPTTSYWSTGCCSTTGTQVTGDSTVNNTYSTNDMNSRCAGTVTNVQTGQNSAVPVVSCSTTTTTTTTVAPTTSSTSTTTTTVAPTGTTYYACCTNGAGVSGTYANSNAAVTGLNAACNADEPGIGNTTQGGVSTTPTGCNPATTTTTTAAPNTGTTVTTTTTTAAPVTTGATPAPTTTTTAAPPFFPYFVPLCSDPSILNQSQCSSCGYYWSVNYGECSSTSWTTTTAAPTTTTTTTAAPTTTTTTTAAPVTTGATPAPTTTTTTAAPTTTTTAAPVTTGATPAPTTTTTTAAPTTTTTTTAAPATTTTAAPANQCSEPGCEQYSATSSSCQQCTYCVAVQNGYWDGGSCYT